MNKMTKKLTNLTGGATSNAPVAPNTNGASTTSEFSSAANAATASLNTPASQIANPSTVGHSALGHTTANHSTADHSAVDPSAVDHSAAGPTTANHTTASPSAVGPTNNTPFAKTVKGRKETSFAGHNSQFNPTPEQNSGAEPKNPTLAQVLTKLWGRFTIFARRHPLLLLAICLLGIITLASIFAGVLAPFNPKAQNLYATNQAPSALHWMGTDSLGRDVFSRLLYAGRVSLWVGFVAVGISISIGLALGLVAGYFGGIVDELVMRLTDIMLCFPSFFLILAVIAFLEPSLLNIMVIIGLTSWMGVARLVRAETLTLRERDYVAASRLAGGGPGRILFLHILPNALGPVIVSATLGVGGAILIESSLSFLGLGVQPPIASWGNMLMEGKESLDLAPWLSVFPGLAILFTVLGYNLLGESLRDILDPRLK